MNWLDYDVSVVPIQSLELHQLDNRDRLFATISEGLDGRGSLGILREIALCVAMDSDDLTEDRNAAYDEGQCEGLRSGLEQLVVLRNRVENDIHFKDIPEEVAADLICEIDTLYDELEAQKERLTPKPG